MKFQKLFFGLAFIIAFTACKSGRKLFLAGSAPADKYVAQVKMQDISNLQILPVTINGKTYRFLFDTGAPMVISEELQAELNPKLITKRKVTDSQGNSKLQDYVRLADIEVGGQHFTDLTAIVIDLKATPVIGCFKMDGIIGANLMRLAIWQMDYKNGTLTFTNDTSKLKAPSSAWQLPFQPKATFTPIVNVTVESTEIKGVTFDTGSGSGLSIGSQALPHFNLTDSTFLTSFGYHSYGVYGTHADTVIYAKHPLIINGQNTDSLTFNINKANNKMLLGSEFLRQFVVTMNWQKRMIYLENNDAAKPSKGIGFSPYFNENKLYVGSVILHSKADKLGVAFNDRILKLNGIDCSELSAEKFCEVLALWQNKDQTIQVELEGKGSFTFDWEPLF